MIILTDQNAMVIAESIQYSRTVDFCGFKYLLAEVNNNFNPSEKEMKTFGMDFWWELAPSSLDATEYKLRKYQGGIIEGIMEQLSVSKEQNLAFAIYAICQDRKADVWQIWDRSILTK